LSVFDALPAEIANSPTEISISLQTCCKTEMVDDTSAAGVLIFQQCCCGCSEDGRFSGRIGGVTPPTPLALQSQRVPSLQVSNVI